MAQTQYTSAEIVRRGQALYEQEIRSKLETENKGKYLIINVETGEFEMDADDLAASKRAKVRFQTLLCSRCGSVIQQHIGLAEVNLFSSETLTLLGDGSTVSIRKYEATVIWDGQDREVLVQEVAGGPIAGISLLYGSRVTLDIVDGGLVTLEARTCGRTEPRRHHWRPAFGDLGQVYPRLVADRQHLPWLIQRPVPHCSSLVRK